MCVCLSNISADQDQTELRPTTWLLRVSRVCDFAFVWTAMTPLINYFINALQICEHCPPEPPQSRAHQSQSLQSPPRLPTLRNKQSYTCSCASWTGILSAVRSRSVRCILTDCCVLQFLPNAYTHVADFGSLCHNLTHRSSKTQHM